MPPDNDRIRPTRVHAPHGSEVFEIEWGDGAVCRLPHRILRGYCPCAGCQGHGSEIRFHEPPNLELRDISQVGNYALSLTWGDSHSSGIYTFIYLRRLCDLTRAHGDSLPETHPEISDA